MAYIRLSISVAMCTYNGSRFLPEQFASIAAQTRLPDEMVICDDGSTDNTPEIVEEFSRSVPFPVRFIRNPENLGSTRNFEKGIGLCTGDLIALCDQDDIWLPEKLARQAEMMESDPALGGVFCDAELMDAASVPIGKCLWAGIKFSFGERKQFRAGRGSRVLLRKNVVTGATMMVRASLRTQFLPIPPSWVHDGWIAWMLTVHSSLAFIPAPTVRYRLHANQQLGIGDFLRSERPSLLERLKKGKREEPAIHLLHARQLRVVEAWLAKSDDAKATAALPSLRRAIQFYENRGHAHSSRWMQIACIFRNAANYRRYDCGSKCLLRDLIIACL